MQLSRWSLAILGLYVVLGLGCSKKIETATYKKDGIEFAYPKNWKISEDTKIPDERTITIDTRSGSHVLLDSYDRHLLEREAKHRSLMTSLSAYAGYFARREITTRPESSEPTYQSFVQVGGRTGLKEKQDILIKNIVSDTSIREFFRYNSPDRAVFVILDASYNNYKMSDEGFNVILKTLKVGKVK